MSKYSVLLVDDEEEVFQVMMKKLNWEEMGFSIAGYAKNGIEALEMAEDLQLDVVMTDIKMPYMDGLELCKKLKELYSGIKVIIFSGFDEFEYAKEAIKIEAEEYILKPIDSEELRSVFLRIRQDLDRERDEKRNLQKLEQYYLQSLPVLQESFYVSLVEGNIAEERISQLAESYQIPLKGPCFVAALLHISNQKTDGDGVNAMLKLMAVKQLADESLFGDWKGKSLTFLGDILLIVELPEKEAIRKLTDDFDRLCRAAQRVCAETITIGIGQVQDHLSGLQGSYQGAKNAVSYRVIYGTARAINIAEIDPGSHSNTHWETDLVSSLLKHIKMGNRELVDAEINDLIVKIFEHPLSIENYRVILLELVSGIYRFAVENEIKLEEVLEGKEDLYQQVIHLDSPNALKIWLQKSCSALLEKLMDERMDSTKSFVKNAISYVQEHFADQELGIEVICKHLNVSAAYFSTIFKKETGKTFVGYLTDYRMQQAANMLLEGDLKTYIVAEKVGYADSNYFSYVFKKQYGISPSKYRSTER